MVLLKIGKKHEELDREISYNKGSKIEMKNLIFTSEYKRRLSS